jgi:hypothetical protein
LLEPQRTNLATYSEQADQYIKIGATIGSNVLTSPDGFINADSIIEDASTGGHVFYNFSLTTFTAAAHTASVFAKKGGRDFFVLSLYDGAVGHDAYFNLNTGTLGNLDAGVTATITNYGNGWYRCTVTATTAASTGGIAIYAASANGTDSYAGTNGLAAGYFYGWQLEVGSYVSSYIPTLGSSVTRLGETSETTSLQSASLIGATAGTFFVQATKTDDAVWFNQRIFLTSTLQRALLMDTSAGQIRLRIWDAASALGATITTSGLVNGLVKYLINWDGTTVKVFANGVLVGSSAQPSYAYTTYSTFESASFSNNEISQVSFFPIALTDAECIQLTAL